MFLAVLLLITGLTISSVAIYYSVIGMAAIFSAAPIPIYIMGTTLEIAKLVGASWLKAYWTKAPGFVKSYMMIATLVLMMITSMGIFGFLSKAHTDQNLVSGDVLDRIAIIDEKIKTQKDNIDAARKALAQMDSAVDQTLARSTSEGGAGRSAQLRKAQSKERSSLRNEIETSQLAIRQLNDERAPIAKDLRKVEAEVGPIKYIAAFVYGDNPSQNILEKAVTWVIIMIVIVFDPLAVIMLLAAQMTFGWNLKSVIKEEKIVDHAIPSHLNIVSQYTNDNEIISTDNKESIEDIIEREARKYHPKSKSQILNDVEPLDEDLQQLHLKPKDFLYKEYAKDKFEGIIVNSDEEPELAEFIKQNQDRARFNNYSQDILKYYSRRIYELRKNNSNNSA